MPATNAQATFPGLLKEIYQDEVIALTSGYDYIQTEHPHEEAQLIGDVYVASPRLLREHGFSYAPSTGSGTTITFNAPVAGYIGRAKIQPYAIYLRSQVDYAIASRAAQRGKQAVQAAYRALLENMQESFQIRLEHNLLYGQDGLGMVTNNASGVLTISDATWSAIWFALEGAVLEAWTGVSASETQHNGDLTVSAVSISAKTVTVTGTSAAVVANDWLYFKGARAASSYAEAAGIYRALTNTGTLHDISATTYSAWRAQSQAVGGQLSELEVGKGLVKTANAGSMEKMRLLASPASWNILNQEQMAKRMFDSSYSVSKAQSGTRVLEYFAVTQQSVEVVPHPLVREGNAMAYAVDRMSRIGSTDITGQLDSLGELVLHIPDKNVFEVRLMSDTCMFYETPARGCNYSGITN